MKPKKIILTIAGLPVAFTLRNRSIHDRICRRYRGYIRSSGRTVLHLDCRFSAGFKSTRTRLVLRQEHDQMVIIRRDFSCAVQGSSGHITMRPSIYGFDACVRILYATLLPKFGGLLVHAAGLAKGRKAYVCAGVSESGKTTISRLFPGKVLNDEIVGIRFAGKGRIRIFGTPFWGEMGTGPVFQQVFQLKALFFLKKSKINKREALRPGLALQKLLRCCCCFSHDPAAVKQVFETAHKVVGHSPAFVLEFTLSHEFLKYMK